MNFRDGKPIEDGGMTATVMPTCDHIHTYSKTNNFRLYKTKGEKIFEQMSRCIICGEEIWQAVPVAKEATDDHS